VHDLYDAYLGSIASVVDQSRRVLEMHNRIKGKVNLFSQSLFEGIALSAYPYRVGRPDHQAKLRPNRVDECSGKLKKYIPMPESCRLAPLSLNPSSVNHHLRWADRKWFAEEDSKTCKSRFSLSRAGRAREVYEMQPPSKLPGRGFKS
jgi:hypothetical protein